MRKNEPTSPKSSMSAAALDEEAALDELDRPSMTDLDDETVNQWERHKSRRLLAALPVSE